MKTTAEGAGSSSAGGTGDQSGLTVQGNLKSSSRQEVSLHHVADEEDHEA